MSESNVGVAVGRLEPRPFRNGYFAKRRLVIPFELVGARLTDFLYLVRLSGEWLAGMADPPPIRFEQDGEKLPHEVESYDPARGSLRAWVRLPLIAENADTVFRICYRCAEPGPDEADPIAVWAGFQAAWSDPLAARP